MEKSTASAHVWYCRSLKHDLAAKKAMHEKRTMHLALRDEFLRRQKDALARSANVKPYPRFNELAAICGISERRVRYAYAKRRKKIAELAGAR
jgi:hypothetical protein